MTMNFETLLDSIVTLLGDEAGGHFRVIGYQPQGASAEGFLGNNRTVQVYFFEGENSQRGGGSYGALKHNTTYKLEFTAAAESLVDLSVVENPASTAPEISAALSAFQNASKLAGASLNELYGYVFNVIMDQRNIDLGMDRPVGSRWIQSFRVDPVMPRGGLAIATGSAELTCSIDEQVQGFEALNV
jgi:hypothetical protein